MLCFNLQPAHHLALQWFAEFFFRSCSDKVLGGLRSSRCADEVTCVGFDGSDGVGLLEISWEVSIQSVISASLLLLSGARWRLCRQSELSSQGSSTGHIMEGARADDLIYVSNDEFFQVDTVLNATLPESQGLKLCAVNHTFVRGPRQEDRISNMVQPLDAGASMQRSYRCLHASMIDPSNLLVRRSLPSVITYVR